MSDPKRGCSHDVDESETQIVFWPDSDGLVFCDRCAVQVIQVAIFGGFDIGIHEDHACSR